MQGAWAERSRNVPQPAFSVSPSVHMLILTSEQNLWKMSGGCSAKIHPNANDPVRCPCRDKRISGFIVLQKQESSVTPLGALDRGFLSGLRRGRHQKLSPAKELGLL